MIAGEGRRRRRLVLACAVIAVVAIGAAVYAVGAGDDSLDPRAGSVALDDEPGLFDFGVPPEAYRVDYRVEGYGGDAVVTTSDRLFVRRPFESRLESFEGAVPGERPSSVQIAAFGRFAVEGAQTERVVVAAPPAPGISDVRIAPSLPAALDDDRFELRERRRVAGRECQVIRTAVMLGTGDLAPPRSSPDHADTCIDADGIVLEEVLFDGGEPLLRRVATDVEIDPELDDALFEIGEPSLPTAEGGGFIGELVRGSRPPGTFYDVAAAPAGFDHRGRYAVVPAQADNFGDETRRAQRLTFVSDVYVDGPHLLILDQGGTLGGVEPFADVRGVDVDVDIDGAGDAVLTYGQGGPIVIVRLGDGRFLRARTTATPEALLALLADLRPVEGGELELVSPTS